LERIELYQLHRIDPKVPLADQLGALVELQAEGKIGRIGPSEVSLPEIETATAITPIATVQNLYNLSDRSAEPVLDYCQREDIGSRGFRWPPVDWPDPAAPLGRIADEHAATPAQGSARVAASALTRAAPDPRRFQPRRRATVGRPRAAQFACGSAQRDGRPPLGGVRRRA
jgi:hypothetical protein